MRIKTCNQLIDLSVWKIQGLFKVNMKSDLLSSFYNKYILLTFYLDDWIRFDKKASFHFYIVKIKDWNIKLTFYKLFPKKL